jgi:hypothetical protein
LKNRRHGKQYNLGEGATYVVKVENERVRRSRRRFIFYLALPIGYIQLIVN